MHQIICGTLIAQKNLKKKFMEKFLKKKFEFFFVKFFLVKFFHEIAERSVAFGESERIWHILELLEYFDLDCM
jgi:hypothetical protein